MLVVALVHSCLDYGNSTLAGIAAYLTRRLQSVLNAAARLIYQLRSSDHITDALVCLHIAADTRAQRVQDRSADLQSHEWYGTAISGTILSVPLTCLADGLCALQSPTV